MVEDIIVRLEIKNQKIKIELEEVISSLDGFHIQQTGDLPSCDVLFLEIGDDLKKEFQFINSAKSSGAVKEVFLTSSSTESTVLIQALKMGVKEFFPQPIKKDDVISAFLALKNTKQQESVSPIGAKIKKGKIINIIGSKGGVGTTTIVVNMATNFIKRKEVQSVALVDMNLLFGEIPLFLDIDPVFDWGEIAKDISRLDPTYLKSILFKDSSGVYVLPSPTRLDGIHAITPEVIERILDLMKSMFDFIVIDSGHSFDDISLKILETSDTVFLVSTLSIPCLANIKRLMGIYQRLGFPREENIKIIINRYCKKCTISLKEVEESINKKIYWQIPNDYIITMSAINQGVTLSAIAPKTKISKSFEELASTFLEPKEEKKENTVSMGWKLGFLGR
jgi:pilus assembly protein CpaE